jgi:RNA polymerase sigma-70 factor (ECF subfamily)
MAIRSLRPHAFPGSDESRPAASVCNAKHEGPLTTGADPPGRPPPLEHTDPVLDRLERVFLERLDHLYNFLRVWLRDDYLAEDVTQQVFLKACQARDRFRGDDDAMVGWLFRIARNEAINVSRLRGRETSWDAMRAAAPEPVDPGEPPDVAALRSEQRREVAHLLDRLSPAQRELLHLRFGAGLSLVQIAGTLGISDVAARQRLRRTLAQLKGAIDDPTTLR